MKWSTNETCQFVKIYLKHEIMWNPKHIWHRRKIDRLKAMREICAEFRIKTGIGLSDTEANLKIRTLRSTYFQEIAKIKRRRSGMYTPKIKWFSEWHKCYAVRVNALNGSVDNENEEAEGPGLSEQYLWVTQNDDTDPFSDRDYKRILKTEPNDLQEIPDSQIGNNNKNQAMPHSPSSVSDGTFMDCVPSSSETVTKEDEFDIYGKYIATQLRKMDLHKALKVQLQIQTVVSEARISEIISCD